MAADDWKRMDDAEGTPYKRIKLTVLEAGLEDCPLDCQAYKVVDPTGPHLPSKLYHEKIVRGIGVLARAIGLVGHILEESNNPMAIEIWQRVEDEATAHIRPGA